MISLRIQPSVLLSALLLSTLIASQTRADPAPCRQKFEASVLEQTIARDKLSRFMDQNPTCLQVSNGCEQCRRNDKGVVSCRSIGFVCSEDATRCDSPVKTTPPADNR
ncbi:hypothetical protein [Cohaesibacter haloalkalitolerans]|uniref:hypothetical protein n=1 Tax=Cohaesibacter haloalkalitolerans TaxID=1162980 RepID=UPI0013C420A1|nr:hypothetical protein [Cohaesibacter haloalkalitolerans]